MVRPARTVDRGVQRHLYWRRTSSLVKGQCGLRTPDLWVRCALSRELFELYTGHAEIFVEHSYSLLHVLWKNTNDHSVIYFCYPKVSWTECRLRCNLVDWLFGWDICSAGHWTGDGILTIALNREGPAAVVIELYLHPWPWTSTYASGRMDVSIKLNRRSFLSHSNSHEHNLQLHIIAQA